MIQKLSVYKVKTILNSGVRLYLAEDCQSMAVINYNRGIEVTLDRLENLKKYGFIYLWVSDESISEEPVDKILSIKRKISSIFSKSLSIFHESDLKQNLKYIESNDLLRYPLEVLQLDGAFLLLRKSIGTNLSDLTNQLSKIFISMYNQLDPQVGIFDHVCLGNLYRVESSDKFKRIFIDSKEMGERSNYIVRLTVSKVIAYVATLKNIQLYRKKNNFGVSKKLYREGKRGLYEYEHLIESILSVFFSEYGLCHLSIEKIILNKTAQFFSFDEENEKEVVDNLGFALLDSLEKITIDKHANVSHNLFYMKGNGFCQELGRNIFRFHHRGMREKEGRFPVRKFEKKFIFIENEGKVIHETNVKIEELSRLAYICSFFVQYLFQMPLHLPCNRDHLVRFLLDNSEYPVDKNGNKLPKEIYDLETQYSVKKDFDGYLVEMFLKSIHIYMIGEKVPIYYLNYKKKYDAVIYSYNDMPHQPVVKIIFPENLSGKLIDLSHKKNSVLRIGEYLPVIDITNYNKYMKDIHNNVKKKKDSTTDSIKNMLNEYLDDKKNQEIPYVEEDFSKFQPHFKEIDSGISTHQEDSIGISNETEEIDSGISTHQEDSIGISNETEEIDSGISTHQEDSIGISNETEEIDSGISTHQEDSINNILNEDLNDINLNYPNINIDFHDKDSKFDKFFNTGETIDYTTNETITQDKPNISTEDVSILDFNNTSSSKVQVKLDNVSKSQNLKMDEPKKEVEKLYYIYLYMDYLSDYFPYGIGSVYNNLNGDKLRVKICYVANQEYIKGKVIYYKFLKLENQDVFVTISHPKDMVLQKKESYFVIYSKLPENEDILNKRIEYTYKTYSLNYSYCLLMDKDNDPLYLIKIDLKNNPDFGYILRSVEIVDNKISFKKASVYNQKIKITDNNRVKIGKKLSISEIFEYFQLEAMI